MLLPGRWRRPYREDPRYSSIVKRFQGEEDIRIVFYSVPFGPVPLELDETYPIAQTESLEPDDPSVYVTKAVAVSRFLKKFAPDFIMVIREGRLGEAVNAELQKWLSKPKLVSLKGPGVRPDRLARILKRKPSMRPTRTSSGATSG